MSRPPPEPGEPPVPASSAQPRPDRPVCGNRRGQTPGRLLTFEGPEGCGKSTQARRLALRLESAGRWVVSVREPGGTATGEEIRRILQHDLAGEPIGAEAETLLFEASRAQLCRRVILPAREAGAWVLCDRFFDSTTAYQGFGRGLDVERLIALNEFAACGAVPDLTFLLDLDIEAGFRRLARRQSAGGATPDRMEREARAFHERVRHGYLELASRWPDRIVRLDASGDPDSVSEAVWSAIEDAGMLSQ